MSIHHSNLELTELTVPNVYLLHIDSSFNLRSNDTQVLPLHILNNSTDHCQNQLVSLKQQQVEECNQYNNVQEYDKQYLLPTSLQCVTLKQVPSETCETELVTPSVNLKSDQSLELENNEHQIKKYMHISDRNVPPRAVAVLPHVLQIRRKDLITPRRTLFPRTRFGPVQGIEKKLSTIEANEQVLMAVANKTPLFLFKDKCKQITYIDVSDKDKSNWIGLLPLGDEHTANLWIYEEKGGLYVITTDAVPSRKQLMLGYSKKYAEDYGLVGPCKDILSESPLKQKSWWCYECQRAMPSAIALQRHIEAGHEEDVPVLRRGYRCRHCSRTFSRIFTLRRHVALHCEKKLSKSNNPTNVQNNTETLSEPTLNSTLNSDDNRLPSDESFQNYSNGLDFSTNLFDTDRIPGLDLSGNSRSEVFTPYGLENDVPLTNDLGYTNECSNKTVVTPTSDKKKNQQEKNFKPPLESCPYCKQDIVKGKKRQHVSECPARRFECECKKVFTNKELLTRHIFTVHSNETVAEEEKPNDDTKNDTSTDSQNTMSYSCDQCQHTFKRRGMLVNHLWRVHGAGAGGVPLARPLRHYPCGACHKLYRSAAKRDNHRAHHHPGAEKIRVKPMEGGTRLCTPAACSACPRQYATRAKLLQHQRYCHPDLVPPPKKTNSAKKSTKTNGHSNASEELMRNKANLQHLLHFY